MSLDAAVQAGVEFLQVNARRPGSEGARVAVATEVTEETDRVEAVDGGQSRLEGLLADLTRLVGSLLARQTTVPPRRAAAKVDSQAKLCWSCNQAGHLRRNCPNSPIRQGNAGSS